MVAPVAAAAIGAGASVIGKGIDAVTSKAGSDKAWKRQKNVLQKQVQWRVADAEKAGLHPLAALGMSPAAVGGQWMGTDFGSLGQDIGRAAEALAEPEVKTDARLLQLGVERSQLENELLKTQIASARQRMLQDANPGVSTMPQPFMGDMPVANKELAQTAESNFGEIIGELYGVGNYLQSKYKQAWAEFAKKFPEGYPGYTGRSAISKVYDDFINWYTGGR